MPQSEPSPPEISLRAFLVYQGKRRGKNGDKCKEFLICSRTITRIRSSNGLHSSPTGGSQTIRPRRISVSGAGRADEIKSSTRTLPNRRQKLPPEWCTNCQVKGNFPGDQAPIRRELHRQIAQPIQAFGKRYFTAITRTTIRSPNKSSPRESSALASAMIRYLIIKPDIMCLKCKRGCGGSFMGNAVRARSYQSERHAAGTSLTRRRMDIRSEQPPPANLSRGDVISRRRNAQPSRCDRA